MRLKAEDFSSLVDEYGKKVYNLAFRITFNRQDAEDAVQETFVQVFKGLEAFRGESAVGTWIYRIAVNVCLQMKRRFDKDFFASLEGESARTKGELPPEAQDWFADPAKAHLAKELITEVRQGCHQMIMQELPDPQRLVFILRDIFDLSYREIGEILELEGSVVKSRLKRAREALALRFQEKCGWYSDGGTEECCKSNIGYALTHDHELLRRAEERIGSSRDGNHPTAAAGKSNDARRRDYLAYVFKKLPNLAYDSQKVKIMQISSV